MRRYNNWIKPTNLPAADLRFILAVNPPKCMTPENAISKLFDWAEKRRDISAVCIVGSYARGTARPDSDIDAVILCDDPKKLLSEKAWLEGFGQIARTEHEDWGALQSLRTYYQDGLEIEFGLALPSWAAIPVDSGTREVVLDGMRILYDPSGLLRALEKAAVSPVD